MAMIAVYWAKDMREHVNTVLGQNTGFVNVRAGGTYSNQCSAEYCREMLCIIV